MRPRHPRRHRSVFGEAWPVSIVLKVAPPSPSERGSQSDRRLPPGLGPPRRPGCAQVVQMTTYPSFVGRFCDTTALIVPHPVEVLAQRLRESDTMTDVTFHIRERNPERVRRWWFFLDVVGLLLSRGTAGGSDVEVSRYKVDMYVGEQVLQSFGAESLAQARGQVDSLRAEVTRDGIQAFCDHHSVPNARRPKG
jgi:hypothetical protein